MNDNGPQNLNYLQSVENRLAEHEARIAVLEYKMHKAERVLGENFPVHYTGDADPTPDPSLNPLVI